MVSKESSVILIAGDTSDIGQNVRELCQRHNLIVVGFSRKSASLPIDASEPIDLAKLINLLQTKNYKISGVVFLIGGIVGTGKATELNQSDIEKTFVLNVTTLLNTAKAVAPFLIEGASWINISSMMVKGSSPFNVHYAASKAGVEIVTKSLADEWKSRNIKVVCFRLGATATKTKLNDPYLKPGTKLIPVPEISEKIMDILTGKKKPESGTVIEISP